MIGFKEYVKNVNSIKLNFDNKNLHIESLINQWCKRVDNSGLK